MFVKNETAPLVAVVKLDSSGPNRGAGYPVLATQFICVQLDRKLTVLHCPAITHCVTSGVTTIIMLSQLAQCAKKLLSRLGIAADQLFRHLTRPASSNLVTSTLADLPRSRSELIADVYVLFYASN